MLRTIVLPDIVVVWGAAVVISGLSTLGDNGGAYGAGQTAAVVFGVVLVLAGGRALLKAARERA